MLDMDTLTWEEPLAHRMKVERNLNFATLPDADDEYGFSRKKTARDPMSHRIIEKRRRDRMNNCLADLSRLVPTNYLKKGRGRIEKTEIIEMAIKHLKHLQAHPCKDPGNCEVAKATEQDHKRQFRQGYQECMSETMKFMMELEGSWVVDGLGIRLVNHLQKHYDKLSGGICYTQALNMMASEESKPTVHMEVDNHSSSCFPPESNSNGGLHPEHNNHSVPYYENNRSSEAPPELKHEIEMNGHHASPTNVENPPSKVTSQLREMLQNPGVPKDSSRCNGVSAPTSPHSQPMAVVINNPTTVNEPSKTEDGCYKFKNNIKHRFNNDLRHHTSSPTDSHLSDRMSLPDEDNAKLQVSESSPLRPCHPGEDRLNHNGGPPVLLCSNGTSHAFSPYQPSHAVSELSVKIPDRTVPSDNGTLSSYGNQHWDSHAETASSCGSNPSPPPNTARSSGSSSGYSTNGENNSGSGKMKGAHSPALSPYSRTPDRLSNRSPSPCQPGVPIFALHPKGTFYIPLTIEASLLIPYMVGIDDMAPVLHPISICVNLSSHSVKVEKITNGNSLPYRPPVQSSYLMDKFHDRFVYSERHMFYPCPNSPAKNGCA